MELPRLIRRKSKKKARTVPDYLTEFGLDGLDVLGLPGGLDVLGLAALDVLGLAGTARALGLAGPVGAFTFAAGVFGTDGSNEALRPALGFA